MPEQLLNPLRQTAVVVLSLLFSSLLPMTQASEQPESSRQMEQQPENMALQPFTSDGCSIFPNGTLEDQKLWLSCCQKHDYDYWKGGSEAERLASDEALRECVAAVGEPRIAQLMLTGVRLGGSPYLPTKFRWGYGWPYLRGYKALTPEEQAQVHKLSQTIEW